MLFKLSNQKLVLVDDQKLPRYWAAVWELLNGGGLAESTLREKLGHIEALYLHVEARDGSLDDSLARLDFDALSNALESLFVTLRNVPAPTQRAQKRWNAAFHFVRDACDRIASNPHAGNRMADIRSRIERLDRLYLGLRPLRKRFGRKSAECAQASTLLLRCLSDLHPALTPEPANTALVDDDVS